VGRVEDREVNLTNKFDVVSDSRSDEPVKAGLGSGGIGERECVIFEKLNKISYCMKHSAL
jgi:hypothetical protein